MKTAVPIALVCLIEGAAGCMVPPPSVLREHTSLLSEANSVALVEVVQGAGSKCVLRTLRSWKAAPPKPLPLACKTPTEGHWITDFADHKEIGFWKGRMGRLGVSADCSVLPPAFLVGKQYVLLLGIAPDTKQYEQVSGATDEWLRFVEQTLRGSRR